MNNEQLTAEERVLKEYPYSTHWVEGRKVIGVGNLILTNRRLVYLHRVVLSDHQIENIRKMSEHSKTDRILDFSLTLDKRNFQIPLSAVFSANVGLFWLLPFPRPCLRISYGTKKGEMRTASFVFTIPMLRGFFQFEIADDITWAARIRKAASYWK